MMERILGSMPYRMTKKTKTNYFWHGRLDWDPTTSAGRYVRENCKPLYHYLRDKGNDHLQILELIELMLEYSPEARILLKDALRHSFFESIRHKERADTLLRSQQRGSQNENAEAATNPSSSIATNPPEPALPASVTPATTNMGGRGAGNMSEKEKDKDSGGDSSAGLAGVDSKRRRFTDKLGLAHTIEDPTDSGKLDGLSHREKQLIREMPYSSAKPPAVEEVSASETAEDSSSSTGGTDKPSSIVQRRRAARQAAMKSAKSLDYGTLGYRPQEPEPHEEPRCVLDRPIPRMSVDRHRQRTDSKGEAPVTAARRRRKEKLLREKTPPLADSVRGLMSSGNSFDTDEALTTDIGTGGDASSHLNPTATEFVPKSVNQQQVDEESLAEKERKRKEEQQELKKKAEQAKEKPPNQGKSLTLTNMKFPTRPRNSIEQETQTIQERITRIFAEKSTQTPDNFYPPIPTNDVGIDANQFSDSTSITSTVSIESFADLSLDVDLENTTDNVFDETTSVTPVPQMSVFTVTTGSEAPNEAVVVGKVFPPPVAFNSLITSATVKLIEESPLSVIAMSTAPAAPVTVPPPVTTAPNTNTRVESSLGNFVVLESPVVTLPLPRLPVPRRTFSTTNVQLSKPQTKQPVKPQLSQPNLKPLTQTDIRPITPIQMQVNITSNTTQNPGLASRVQPEISSSTPQSQPSTPKSLPGTPKNQSSFMFATPQSQPGTPQSQPGTPQSQPGTPQSQGPGTPFGTPKAQPASQTVLTPFNTPPQGVKSTLQFQPSPYSTPVGGKGQPTPNVNQSQPVVLPASSIAQRALGHEGSRSVSHCESPQSETWHESQGVEPGSEVVLPKMEKARARRRRRMDRKKKVDSTDQLPGAEVQNENVPLGGAMAASAALPGATSAVKPNTEADKKNMKQLNSKIHENLQDSDRKMSTGSGGEVFVLASDQLEQDR